MPAKSESRATTSISPLSPNRSLSRLVEPPHFSLRRDAGVSFVHEGSTDTDLVWSLPFSRSFFKEDELLFCRIQHAAIQFGVLPIF
jgi:hypothetical protein